MHGDMVMMGQESDTVRLFLESMIFTKGRETFTQISVLRFTITSVKEEAGKTVVSGDQQVVASHVVKGLVRFTTQRQALEVFNRFARQFGFRPLAIPKELK